MGTPEFEISCKCGAAAQVVKRVVGAWPPQTGPGDGGINICHCKTCRHTTGVLCTSYIPIDEPPLLRPLKAYDSSSSTQRLFCSTCGCHVFCRYESAGHVEWAVATGVISDTRREGADGDGNEEEDQLRFVRHINVADTKDGGVSPWIAKIAEERLEVDENSRLGDLRAKEDGMSIPLPLPASAGDAEGTLQAFCHCGTVRFHITRPDDMSRTPHSGFSDLIIPFHANTPEIKNPDDCKWWLRPENAARPTQYLAGTCACKSCRLISGFEIQTWAFVPRTNIIFHIPVDAAAGQSSESVQQGQLLPLDFATLPPGILRTYKSSPGVFRESCVNCGATVFWHDKWRPDLIDVSVGLLDAPEGARAESWLDWWKGRVSFFEHTDNGRSGAIALGARNLMESLQRGLKASA